jgi:alkylhydroperoxidase family enzyme
MRLSSPRIAPLQDDELDAAVRGLVEPLTRRGPLINVFRTLAQAPRALHGFLHWGGYVLGPDNDLPPRERELAILRIAFLCRAGYEWAQHVPIGLRAGLSGEEIVRVKRGPEAAGWNEADRALLWATEELHHDQFIAAPTWAELSRWLSEKQRMDLVFTVAQYTQVAMILNSFGVQLDAGLSLDADLVGG